MLDLAGLTINGFPHKKDIKRYRTEPFIKTMNEQPQGTTLFIPVWLVWASALCFVLIGLGSGGILDNNEGLYAGIPREMLASHDWRRWVIPHLNGLPYMEKPPLLYWLTALSFALFGESEWSARAVPALSALACVAMLLWFGRSQRQPQAGRLAALMFVSGVGVAAMSRVLMFDMLLTALLTAALMCAYRYLSEGSVRWLRWAYAFLALALLAKGFVALVLFGLATLGFMLMSTRSPLGFLRACGTWFEPWAILIFCMIAVPWHLAASLSEPIFAWFYFINEHVLRFLGKREPNDCHTGAWWYYLPRMAIYLFPWSFLLPCLLTSSRRVRDSDGSRLRQFLWLAWLVPLVFFSISNSKANYYLVVAMPFVAFHLAIALEERDFLNPVLRTLPGLLIALLGVAACVTLLFRAEDPHQPLFVPGWMQHEFALLVSGGMALLGLVCAALAWRSNRIGVLAYLGLSVWIFGASIAVLSAAEPFISTRTLANYLQTEVVGRTVYLYGYFEEQSSLPFYLKHPIPMIGARSKDLFWGNKVRSGNDITILDDQFAQRMQNQPVAVVVTDRQLKDFRAVYYFKRFKREQRIGGTTVFLN